MGILRADRITGLGGADAIKGSVFFGGGGGLVSPESDDFKFCAGGDFTIEAWVNTFEFGNAAAIVACWDQTGADGSGEGGDSWLLNINTSGVLQFAWSPHATDVYFITGGTLTKDTWHHVAVTRNGNTFRIFLDGTQTATGTNSSTNNTNSELFIGRYGNYAYDYYWHGNISNVRILKGEALYTSTFTPPNRELTVTPNTVLVACQSPGNISREATGKHLSIIKKNVNDASPVASSFTPNSPVGFSTTSDVGSQYGSTFNGFGNFATSTYMVPAGGNTRERNRGRGLSMGGATPGISNVISFIEMSSYGQTGDFGDLTHVVNGSPGACSSNTRGIVGGGQSPSSNINTINFVTIANTANALDFGDLSVARRGIAACSSSTRGLWGGGRSDPSGSNPDDTIDFVTIATLGNASDFGNLSVARRYLGSTSSTTRGFWMGGNSPSASDVIDFITITTTGNAADFGNLTAARSSCEACSSATRAIVIGGFISPAYVNTIDFFTMASSGNATDFGDSTTVSGDSSPCSNSIRGYRVGGGNDSTQMNSIDFVTIATTGNAQDFGDLPVVQSEGGGCSDSHGGL